MNSAVKRAIALAFVAILVAASACAVFSDSGEAVSGKYLDHAEITKSFNDLDGGTVTVYFQKYADGEHTLNVKITSSDGKNVFCEKEVVVPVLTGDEKLHKEGFSFKVGNGETVKITAYEGGTDTGSISMTINVEKTIWTNPLVWVVIVIVIIALIVFGVMRYRHVVDKKKDNPKEKVFTKMAEEKKQKKLNK